MGANEPHGKLTRRGRTSALPPVTSLWNDLASKKKRPTRSEPHSAVPWYDAALCRASAPSTTTRSPIASTQSRTATR